LTIQAGVGAVGKTSFQELDEKSLSMVPLDPDALNAAVEKARQYLESLTREVSSP
jgi:hypothetical protein